MADRDFARDGPLVRAAQQGINTVAFPAVNCSFLLYPLRLAQTPKGISRKILSLLSVTSAVPPSARAALLSKKENIRGAHPMQLKNKNGEEQVLRSRL